MLVILPFSRAKTPVKDTREIARAFLPPTFWQTSCSGPVLGGRILAISSPSFRSSSFLPR